MPIVRFKRFPVRVGVRLRVIGLGLGLVRVSDPRRIVSSAHRSSEDLFNEPPTGEPNTIRRSAPLGLIEQRFCE